MDGRLADSLSIIRIRHALRMRTGGHIRNTSARADDWVTINGTHVLIDPETGEMRGGPEKLRAVSDKSKGTKAIHSRRYAKAKQRCQDIEKEMMSDTVLEHHANLRMAQKEVGFRREDEEDTKREINAWLNAAKNNAHDTDYKKFCERKAGELQGEYEKKVAEREKAEQRVKELEEEGKSIKTREQLLEEYDKAASERNAAFLKLHPDAESCEDSKEVTEYLRAREYFKGDISHYDADRRVNLNAMEHSSAVDCAKQLDRLMKDYPGIKGQMDGIDCHDMSREPENQDAYAYARGTRVCFNKEFFKEGGKGKEWYKEDVDDGFHPKGTDYRAIIDHEYAHAIEKTIGQRASQYGLKLDDGNVPNTIMRRVQEKLYGSYSKSREKDVRASVSRYAARNQGVTITKDGVARENKRYGRGRNTEFVAEAMAEARCSSNPSDISKAVREVMEDMMREVRLR